MIKILIVRHGQSTGNIEGKFCGSSYDCELSENGRGQAKTVCDYIYKNYNVKAIYTSSLIRAYQTAEHLSLLTGLKRNQMSEFNEMFCGEWEGLTIAEISSKFEKDYVTWKNNIGMCQPTGGESWQQVIDRLTCGLKKIVANSVETSYNKTSEKQEVVVLATHGGVIRAIELVFRGKGLKEMKDIPFVPNCSITTLNYQNEKFQIENSGFVEFLGDNITVTPKGM